MKIQRLFFLLVFTILLSFAQQASYVHVFSHVNGNEEFSDKSIPNSKICSKCLGFAHLDSFAHVSEVAFDIADVGNIIDSAYAIHSHSSSFFFYHSRAPPTIS